MNVNFFEEPQSVPKGREEVRLRQIGLFVYEDLRRVAVGLELTPFLERPCIELTITNSQGMRSASLTLIETHTPNITLVMHLRDTLVPKADYTLTAQIYYDHPELTQRQVYHTDTLHFKLTAGEQIFPLAD